MKSADTGSLMNFLLDTSVLIWAALSPHRLSVAAALILSDLRNRLMVSAASAWEISTKVRIGKLPGAELFEREFIEQTWKAGYEHIPVITEVALRAGRLPGRHGDPFDRMIAAQALAMDVPVISSDAKLEEFEVRRIW